MYSVRFVQLVGQIIDLNLQEIQEIYIAYIESQIPNIVIPCDRDR